MILWLYVIAVAVFIASVGVVFSWLMVDVAGWGEDDDEDEDWDS